MAAAIAEDRRQKTEDRRQTDPDSLQLQARVVAAIELSRDSQPIPQLDTQRYFTVFRRPLQRTADAVGRVWEQVS